ncbi:MAG: extra-cytoplasmic solute receptor [Hyphomicrobiales bacterium]|nr:extra-cytoplasmic solute receptor [Hyphomicrobiales bacterium]
MISRRSFVGSSLAAPALWIPGSAGAAEWPTGLVRSICPFPAGTGADIKVRWYAKKLTEATGKSVIVENKPGAFGNIATETVARSKPDGNTIYIAPGFSVLAAVPHLFKKLPFDPVNDFEHITTLNTSAFAMFVAGDSPFKTVADLTDHLKKQGSKASYGSIANPGLVSSELYKAAFGLETVEVKYREQNTMFSDLQNGQLAFCHIDIGSSAAYLSSGKARALCMTSAKRLQSLPNIPGSEEVGIPGLDIQTWWSVHVPAKTPKDICDQLEALCNKIAVEPDTVKFLEGTGSDPLPGNSALLKDMLAKDMKNWATYVKIAKIEPQ